MIMLLIKYNSIFYTRNGEVGAVLKRRSKTKIIKYYNKHREVRMEIRMQYLII